MAVEKIKVRALARTLGEVWGNPGTQLGMWIHFTGQFGATVFTMLWGYPFLVEGQGLSKNTAGTLLITLTLSAMVAGPVVGSLTGRLPYRRSQIVLTIVAAIATTWALVLLWPGRAPLPLLVLLVCVTGCGGPGSMVGFDLARAFHPSDRLGRASGVINIGGFFASLVTMALVGLILDARAPEGLEPTPSPTSRSRCRCSSSCGGSARSRSGAIATRGSSSSTSTRARSTPCAPARRSCPASRATLTDPRPWRRGGRVDSRRTASARSSGRAWLVRC